MIAADQYRVLLESLRLVAAPPETQRKAVPVFAVVADEVATTFGDAYLLLPQLVRARLVSEEASAAIGALDQWFQAMPADPGFAEERSLEEHSFWETARQLAAKALDALGEDARPPDLGHITWVP